MRHGKSDWDNDLPDFERPLAKRGLKDVPFMSGIVANYEFKPEIIVSSPAQRAKETARIFASSISCKNDIIYEESFYEKGESAYLNKIQQLDEKFDSAIFIGHNPTLEFCSELICFGKKSKDSKIIMPTSSIIAFALPIESWSEFKPGTGKIMLLLIPKLLKSKKD